MGTRCLGKNDYMNHGLSVMSENQSNKSDPENQLNDKDLYSDKSAENTKKYLNQIEAAKHLGFSKSTVSLMTSRGHLTHYRIGRSVRYLIKDLDNFMESHRVSGACEELGRKAR